MQTAPLLPLIGGCGLLPRPYIKTLSDGGKMPFCAFLYIISFAYMVQYYFFTIFFISFIFNTLHTFSRCNAVIINVLYYICIFFSRFIAQKCQFFSAVLSFCTTF